MVERLICNEDVMGSIPIGGTIQPAEPAMAEMCDCKCKECGGDYTTRLAYIKRGQGMYCSRLCKAKNQEKLSTKNGDRYYLKIMKDLERYA